MHASKGPMLARHVYDKKCVFKKEEEMCKLTKASIKRDKGDKI